MEVSYTDAALEELESIVNFYLAESGAVAERFQTDLQHTEELLKRNPRAGHVVASGRRRLLMKVFPFCLIYRLRDAHKSIEITAIAHQHRRPGYWLNRIHEAPQHSLVHRFSDASLAICMHGREAHDIGEPEQPRQHCRYPLHYG